MKTIKLAACSFPRACVLGRFFTGLRLWRRRLEPIGDGDGRSTDAAGSIRPIATNLVPAAVEVANSNERRSIAAFMNFNTRERKMKPKLVFCSMPKMRQGRNEMAKAMKLLPLLLASGLMSAPAQSECYTGVNFPGYEFAEFVDPRNSAIRCQPSEIFHASDYFYRIHSEDQLWEKYEANWEKCYSNVSFVWDCPVRNKWNDVNRIHSTWQREIDACRQRMDNHYRKYKGRMCK